jgi:hypothetical protein
MQPPLLLLVVFLAGLLPAAHALHSSFMADGTVLHGGQPFFPLGLYAENAMVPWDVVPALRPPTSGQALAARLAQSGWNTIVDYGVGTAPWAHGSKFNPDLIEEFFDGLHNVGMTVIMNLNDATKSPLDKTLWFDNTTEQAINLLVSQVSNHPGLLALAYSTEGAMFSWNGAKRVKENLRYIRQLDQSHVIANLGMFPPDSVTYRNDLRREFCPKGVLADPGQGCTWNGSPCGGGATESACGPRYYELFNDLLSNHTADSPTKQPQTSNEMSLSTQFAFGAQQYDYPASPEAFNASCQKDGWAHLPNGSPCTNASTNGLRDPAEEGQHCIKGDCFSFGYNTAMLNLSAGRCAPKVGTADCASAQPRHSVWTTPNAFSWAATGWRDPQGPADGLCTHWNMDVSEFEAPSMLMMVNIGWQAVANGANGIQEPASARTVSPLRN